MDRNHVYDANRERQEWDAVVIGQMNDQPGCRGEGGARAQALGRTLLHLQRHVVRKDERQEFFIRDVDEADADMQNEAMRKKRHL